MKLLYVTCLREDEHVAAGLFKKAQIDVFSASQTTGYKVHHAIGAGAGATEEQNGEMDKFDSMFLFSFTTAAKATAVLSLAKKHNFNQRPVYPIRVFIVPVESTSY